MIFALLAVLSFFVFFPAKSLTHSISLAIFSFFPTARRLESRAEIKSERGAARPDSTPFRRLFYSRRILRSKVPTFARSPVSSAGWSTPSDAVTGRVARSPNLRNGRFKALAVIFIANSEAFTAHNCIAFHISINGSLVDIYP